MSQPHTEYTSGLIPLIRRAYDSFIVRAYIFGRFCILRQRFLDEIGQYLPENGKILDIGCGFGLFAMYFALVKPNVQVRGFDLNSGRIDAARRTAKKLGIQGVEFTPGDATAVELIDYYNAIYMLDIIHHINPSQVTPLLIAIRKQLHSDGVLLIKDVADRPAYKRLFTWILDKLMDPKTPVSYWSIEAFTKCLNENGFKVHVHQMVDFLPYPHVLYIARHVNKE